MKTKSYVLFVIVLVSFMLTACAPEGETPQPPSPLPATTTVLSESSTSETTQVAPIKTLVVKKGDSLQSLLEPFYGEYLNQGFVNARSFVVYTGSKSYCFCGSFMASSRVFPEIDSLQPMDKIEIYYKGENPSCEYNLSWYRSGSDQNGTYWYYFEEISDGEKTYWRFSSLGTESSEEDWK